MSSDKKNIAKVISQHGSELDDADSSADDQALAARLDKVELLIEEIGKSSELVSELSDYIKDLRDEVKSIRRIRFWMIMLSMLFMLVLIGTLICTLYFRDAWFALQDAHFKVAFIVSITAASVVVLSILLKGAFRSVSDRHQDDLVPPHVRELMNAIKLITGK